MAHKTRLTTVRVDDYLDEQMAAFVREHPELKSVNNLIYLVLKSFFQYPEDWEFSGLRRKAAEE